MTSLNKKMAQSKHMSHWYSYNGWKISQNGIELYWRWKTSVVS